MKIDFLTYIALVEGTWILVQHIALFFSYIFKKLMTLLEIGFGPPINLEQIFVLIIGASIRRLSQV
jgi:hypothetical protein